jgi:hypothetical protein
MRQANQTTAEPIAPGSYVQSAAGLRLGRVS